jgi:hypothetical protein
VPAPSSDYYAFESVTQYVDELTVAPDVVSDPNLAFDNVAYMTLTMQVNGTTTPNGSGSAGFIVDVGADPENPMSLPDNTQDIEMFSGDQTITYTFSFLVGQPFRVIYYLGANTFETGGALSGTADYSDTAMLTGVQVFDSGMNPVLNPTIVSADGLEYTADGVVPEPGSWLLVGSGLVAVGAFRCRKRFVRPLRLPHGSS